MLYKVNYPKMGVFNVWFQNILHFQKLISYPKSIFRHLLDFSLFSKNWNPSCWEGANHTCALEDRALQCVKLQGCIKFNFQLVAAVYTWKFGLPLLLKMEFFVHSSRVVCYYYSILCWKTATDHGVGLFGVLNLYIIFMRWCIELINCMILKDLQFLLYGSFLKDDTIIPLKLKWDAGWAMLTIAVFSCIANCRNFAVWVTFSGPF